MCQPWDKEPTGLAGKSRNCADFSGTEGAVPKTATAPEAAAYVIGVSGGIRKFANVPQTRHGKCRIP